MAEKNITGRLADKTNAYTINLLRVAAGTRAKIIGQIDDLEDDLVAELAKAVGKADQLTLGTLRSLLAVTRDAITLAYQDISAVHASELLWIARTAMARVEETINDIVRVPLVAVKLDADVVRSIATKTLIQGAPSAEWWATQSASLRARFARTMRVGLLQGDDIGDLTRRIRGTKAAGYTDGVMKVSRAQAETLVRTSALAVSNAARLNSLAQNADLLKSIQWSAAMDGRVCPVCIALDGLEWSLPPDGDSTSYGDYEPIGHDKQFPGAPEHFSCRCTLVPVLLSFDELKGEGGWDFGKRGKSDFDAIFVRKLVGKGYSEEEAADILAETRKTADGLPADRQSFDEWLGGKSAAEQDEMLGKGRAAMYRRGELSLQELTDQKNRPLTLDQL